MPLGAFGGRREVMEKIAPLGPVYQAGTLSGNPVAVAAGLATLKLVQAPGFFDGLAAATQRAVRGPRRRRRASAGVRLLRAKRRAACSASTSARRRRHATPKSCSATATPSTGSSTPCSRAGVYLAPSAYEAGFVSSAHGAAELERTIKAAEKAFAGQRG